MNLCAHFQLRLAYITFAFLAACFLCDIRSAQAQPVQDQTDLQQMQQQLASLQSKIASLQQPAAEPEHDAFRNNRVKSVGTHRRTQREPEPIIVDSMQIRLYDLSDIFTVSPQYPAVLPNDLASSGTMFQTSRGHLTSGIGQGGFGGGGLGGGGGGGYSSSGGGGVFSIPSSPIRQPRKKQEAGSISLQSAQVSMTQLVAAIKDTVEPEIWQREHDNAKIQYLGNTLLITATDDMHTQINNLLNLFREHWGKLRTVSVQTYWIRAASGSAADLLDTESQESIGAGVVSPEKWQPFLDEAKSEKRFAYSATLTGHNNQTLHALSGRQRQLTIDAIPFQSTEVNMKANDPEDPFNEDLDDEDDDHLDYFSRTKQIIGFSPVRQSFHHGAAIQITPLATRGGNFVVLDLHAKVNELVEMQLNEQAGGEADEDNQTNEKQSIFVHLPNGEKAEVELDNGEYISYRLNTTVRCPKEQVVLAGSMTYDANADGEQPDLYLFVKVSVHTINEDESDWNSGPKSSSKK